MDTDLIMRHCRVGLRALETETDNMIQALALETAVCRQLSRHTGFFTWEFLK